MVKIEFDGFLLKESPCYQMLFPGSTNIAPSQSYGVGWATMKAFTNDVIILGGRGCGKDDRRKEGVGLKITSLFYIISGVNFKQFHF